MTTEIHCATASVAATFELSPVAHLTGVPAGSSDLPALVRRYRSARSAVVVHALQAWLQDAEADLPAPERRGIALGTETGAGPDIDEFLDESIRRGDHLVNPALFPMTVHNAAAGNAAIAAQCRGPSVVVSAGADSVWSALDTARALLVDGSADLVFVGGFESQRLPDGTTGTLAAFTALSTEPAALGRRHLGPLAAQSHRAGVASRPGPREAGDGAGMAALVGFANAFTPEPVAAGAVAAGAVTR
ncbi:MULTISPECIES: beta-ketoacyl synthase N-terminal-like domain-containing protein [unclassified Micromonospora]|uniref:beta-ketoacyl synthase N-terminal-like domain-containing protein n=2 Tax=Micromonospora TaxID=1873 RepID=UPI0015902D6E|nr:beta-ketoacyl synthase N-terminal-like domain-containing protein [Verrucosispora sp. NA02020]QKW14629.1 beta-ketoacyl synthase chain length factor [Verrucosispora sp. NA02020]